MKKRRHIRLGFLALASLAAAWLLPSLISAERYRRRLQTNLQQVLGRQVRFGPISLQIIPQPGFSIDNVTVLEDRAFGSEAFARVDHVDCDLAAGKLLRGRIALASLRLRGAAINLVRNRAGQWNVEHLAASNPAAMLHGATPGELAIEVEGARLNFKLDADKTPFAVTGLNGRLRLDRNRRRLDFDLTGSPVRTDLGLPTPGNIQLQGSLMPDSSSNGALNATLRTRGAMVYDWIPIVLSRNPEIYGLMDVEAHLTGSLASLDVDARAHVSQLRRWESLPPSGDMPVNLSLRGRLDRKAGEASVESLTADFGASHLVLSGKVTQVGQEPVLNLLAASTNSRLQDFIAFATRLNGPFISLPQPVGLAGSVKGIVAIRGAWPEPMYSGSVITDAAHLTVGSATFPVSNFSIECSGREISLLPAKIAANARISLVAEGVLRLGSTKPERDSGSKASGVRDRTLEPGYRLTVSAHSVPAHDLVGLARDLGLGVARDLDLQGPLTATMSVTSAASTGRPLISGAAELHDDALWLPGLLQPIPVEEARITLEGDRLLVSPITAGFAGSVITARIGHSGPRSEPWTFEAHATPIDLPEAVSWFEAFGHRAPLPWFERIPGLNTLAGRRAAGSGLFSALNARGEFSTPLLRYGQVSLRSFSARAEISKRDLRVTTATFRLSSGKGQASANFDLSGAVPHLAAGFEVQGLRIENWASHLPPQLGELRGSAGFTGRLASEGSTISQLQSNLQGRAQVALANLDLGHFDPVRGAAQMAAWGNVAPARGPITLRSANLALEVQNRRLVLAPLKLEIGGAVFELAGGCDFDGTAEFESTADLRRVNRHWLADEDSDTSHRGRFVFSGDLNALRATTEDSPPAQARR